MVDRVEWRVFRKGYTQLGLCFGILYMNGEVSLELI